jgi:hypothetical protein
MKLVSKEVLIDYIWRSCKADDYADKWFMELREQGYQICAEDERDTARKLASKFSTIQSFISQCNTTRGIDIPEVITNKEIPLKLVGTEIEPLFAEIENILAGLSNE